MTCLPWRVAVTGGGERRGQRLVIGEDDDFPTFQRVPEMTDCYIRTEQLAAEGALQAW